MNNKIKEITRYFRRAVAAQVNKAIDFKEGNYSIIGYQELLNGKVSKKVFEELSKDDKNSPKKDSLSVIIAAKTIRTIFDSQVKKSSDIDELTCIYFIPAVLMKDGSLRYVENRLPWIPRDFLQPIIEEKLSVGNYNDYDRFLSDSIGRIHKISGWKDYINFAEELYEKVTKAKFSEFIISDIELETNVYILKDDTVNATYPILKLYDALLDNYEESKLYENFISLDFKELSPLITNTASSMYQHCGQMGGEYPLSDSQRECINHFTAMKDGEILAVNGPPGTGKTTLLQSIVANMYVKRALNKEKAPRIVAASTNNQAVTNIIESFGKIKVIGYGNLEQRWIEGVNSFAVYFPASNSEDNASKKGYQHTNIGGHNFISTIEDDDNIKKSTEKILLNCNLYFNTNYSTIDKCEERLHSELCKVEDIRKSLIDIFDKFKNYEVDDKTIETYLEELNRKIDTLKAKIDSVNHRVEAWRQHFKQMPLLFKIFKFLKSIRRKIENSNRLFIDVEESFLNESMSLVDIEEKYSYIAKEIKLKYDETRKTYKEIEQLKKQYDDNMKTLVEIKIDIFKGEKVKEVKSLYEINNLIDKTLRYIEFWLSVHYFECRWAKGEDSLTERQKRAFYGNIIEQRYNRLSMVAPCFVMTFYQLPKNFCPQDNGKHHYLYNSIDLLIVDEAGQASPEIAACSFSLAKKALVVGDTYQIQPVWSISETLDKSLAVENNVIESIEQFDKISELGINTSSSSVMLAASESCKYKKFQDRGLFLSEHRRCYDEIISFCNELVYQGKLKPMRGRGALVNKYSLKRIPQMGYKQIDTEYSGKSGGSRFNKNEAIHIVNWIKENFNSIRDAYPKESTNNLIGIITPFTAQVKCIKREIEKTLPFEISHYISIGTVHTFQGAERNIIIMSTVYGEKDGCDFLDANQSMLNVAVSRAKDSFLVFGDINCLDNDKGSASGLLKEYVKDFKI